MKTFKVYLLTLVWALVFLGLSADNSSATPVFVNLGPNRVVQSVTTDSSGNAYLVGYERSPDTGKESAILVTIGSGSVIPTLTYLPSLSGFSESRATSIRGNHIVGFGNSNNQSQGIAWDLGDLTNAIPVMPINLSGLGNATQLFGVNSSGEYVGTSGSLYIAATGTVGGNSIALNLPGSPAIATGISNSGVMVGNYLSQNASSLNAFVATSANNFVNLINPYSSASSAYAISPDSQIVGGSLMTYDPATETNDLQAAVWTGTNYNDLTLLNLPNGSPLFGQILSVTDNGYAVGTSSLGGFIWQSGWSAAQLFNDWALNEFGISIPTWVTSVNDIFFDGENLNFALQGSAYFMSVQVSGGRTEVPEPATLVFLSFSLAAIGFTSFRRRIDHCS